MKNKILAIFLSVIMLFSAFICVLFMSLNTSAAAVTYERDTTWYDESKSILEIKDIPDFLEFMYQLEVQGTADNGASLGYTGNLAAISWDGTMPFDGKTVILTNDIVLNSGITFTENGPSSSDAYCISRIGNQIGFGGVFDGQGHTISGLYISSTKGTGGSIFGVAGAATKYPTSNVTVKNLQVKNSYITSTSRGVATIFASAAFNANVRIENVYSNAHLNSNTSIENANDSAIVGGLVANVGGKLTIDNCVYAGTMSVGAKGTELGRKHFGGFVGITSNRTINEVYYYGSVNVQASAFYGKLSNDKVQYAGKVIGQKTASDANCTDPTVIVENSILAGTVNTKSGTELGTVAGNVTSNTKISVSNTVYTPIKNNSSDVTAVFNSANSSVTITGSPTKITDSSIIGDKSANGLGNGLDTYWVSNTDVNGYPLPMGIVSTFSEESLKHDFVTFLSPSKEELLAELGDKKTNNDQYTDSSYSQYLQEYDAIVSNINKLGADLSSMDIPTLKKAAESKLVGLADKRAEIITALGVKKENSGLYTASSYAEYSAAYDEIVAGINASTDPETIDVASQITSAEAKLVDISDKRAEIIAKLEAKKENNGQYTASSYAEYSAAYDEIVAIINASEDPEIIDVATLLNEAEATLRVSPKPEDVTINDTDSSSEIDVNIYYDGDLTEKTVYSVDVIWDDISFTYNAGYVQWNPEKHSYDSLDGDEGWTDSVGNIKIVNHSNIGVLINVDFEQASTPNGTAVINIGKPQFTLDSADGTAVADAPKNNAVVGKIIVTVNKIS